MVKVRTGRKAYLSFVVHFSAADLVASIVGVKRRDSSSDLPDESENQTKKVKLENEPDEVETSTDKVIDDDDIKDEDPSEDDKMALRQVLLFLQRQFIIDFT